MNNAQYSIEIYETENAGDKKCIRTKFLPNFLRNARNLKTAQESDEFAQMIITLYLLYIHRAFSPALVEERGFNKHVRFSRGIFEKHRIQTRTSRPTDTSYYFAADIRVCSRPIERR